MTSAPTRATGSATTANDNIDTWTPAVPAMPAMSRLELVPMSVIEPASVVTWATGRSTSRAGTSRVCSSSFDAGISMATIGVVFIRPEATPTGTTNRRSDWRAVVTVASSSHVTRVTIAGLDDTLGDHEHRGDSDHAAVAQSREQRTGRCDPE